ncbi:MAG: nuclear transport factor 2 family protein [Acidobacteria bacterium]|nr:nuclear transport factor 2 family protein [Acidobacteriota bacterium]
MNNQDAVLEIHNRWLSLERGGKSSAVLDLCTDDVLWLVPGLGAVRGRVAVELWLQSQPKVRIESLDSSRVEIEVSGGLAVKTADFRTQYRSTQSTIASVISGTHVWILRETAKGEWRAAKVVWSIAAQNP